MTVFARRRVAPLLVAVALLPLASAHAATCKGDRAMPVVVGTAVAVPAGDVRSFTVSLGAGEGVFVDLIDIASDASGDNENGDDDAPARRALKLCDAKGAVVAPRAGDVFGKGGSIRTIPAGERLRFAPRQAGSYTIEVAAADASRELLVRRRDVGTAQAPVVSAALDAPQKGITSSAAPMVFSFEGSAGQWVELRSTSEKDTVLRLAGPDREGNYVVVAENDDSDGLNPMIRRKLAFAGTYFVQVDSLSDEPGEFDLSLKRIEAPKPPPAPAALRPGAPARGRLAGGEDMRIYTLPVAAGRSYRLELTADYDAVVTVGVPNPLEPDDGRITPDANFGELKSQDANTSGTEKLAFTARSNGQVLVRVKSFGIGETDGAYTLTAVDLGS